MLIIVAEWVQNGMKFRKVHAIFYIPAALEYAVFQTD